MKAARIILDHIEPRIKTWCWRDDWSTGYDSSYGLFSKFAKLNEMSASELAQIFVSQSCGQKTSIIRSPNIDLRNSELFNLAEISRILRLSQEQVKNSFLLEQFHNGHQKSSVSLRWCPRCAIGAFHTPIFQLNFLANCPIHHRAILSRCTKCRAQIPYRLRPELFASPFTCPFCGADFAPELRNPKTRSLELRDTESRCISNLVGILKYEDEILPIKLELNRRRKMLGVGEVIFRSADWRRLESHYTGFVKQVLDDLHEKMDGAQTPFKFDEIAMVYKTAVVKTGKVSLATRTRQRQSTTPKKIAISLKNGWENKLVSIYRVYSAIRRHVWRHIVYKHQKCICSAGRHFWWHMEGEKTANFCPVAEAFLRWRMYWEGCGAPSHLFSKLAKDPLGLVCWLADSAPICPKNWTKDAELWVADHIFARSCLGSFRDWIEIAIEGEQNGHVEWNKHALTGKFESYWAVAGRDLPIDPLRIYEQSHESYDFSNMIQRYQVTPAHYILNQSQLAKIRR